MDTFQDFLKSYPTRSYPKGSIIVYQGDSPKYTYVIKSGFAKVYTIASQGDENVIGFDGEYDIFPVATIFHENGEARYFHQAFTDCEVHLVPRTDYLAFVQNHPALMEKLFNYFVDRSVEYQTRINGLSQPKAADKILYALAHLVDRYGKVVKRSCSRMTLPLTQQDFAGFVGLTRETTGTQLKKLQRQGVLQYNRQDYLVYTDKLDALLKER